MYVYFWSKNCLGCAPGQTPDSRNSCSRNLHYWVYILRTDKKTKHSVDVINGSSPMLFQFCWLGPAETNSYNRVVMWLSLVKLADVIWSFLRFSKLLFPILQLNEFRSIVNTFLQCCALTRKKTGRNWNATLALEKPVSAPQLSKDFWGSDLTCPAFNYEQCQQTFPAGGMIGKV